MTECNQSQFEFAPHFSRPVVAQFEGGQITSDGGALLLRETDRRLNVMPRLAACFDDHRNPWFTQCSVEELLGQRIYGLALGYEDLNDHDQLRNDPLLGVLAGKREAGEEPLAGKSTLNRLELSTEKPDRYKKISYQHRRIDKLLVDVFRVEVSPGGHSRAAQGPSPKRAGAPQAQKSGKVDSCGAFCLLAEPPAGPN